MAGSRLVMVVVVAAAAATVAAEEAAAVRETFDSAPAGWQLGEEAERGAVVRDGALVVWVDNSARAYRPMTVSVPGERRDVAVEAEVRKGGGAPTAAIGLVCRDSDAGRYFADVDEQGEVRLGANLKGEGQKVLARLERPGIWREGGNILRLECVADSLSFSVNGERLLAVTDARLAAGSVGLRAGGAGSGRTEARVESLVVTPREVGAGLEAP